jgi:hypothetical protein
MLIRDYGGPRARPTNFRFQISVMKSEDRDEFLKILQAHAQTIEVCEACATTTRELATEVARGGVPAKQDLLRTVDEAERVLAELGEVRREVERLIRHVS